MAVGIAAIPAGALYAFFALHGYATRWTALFAIVIGCYCARQAWKFVDRKFAFTQPFRAFEYAFVESVSTIPDIIVKTQAGESLLVWAKPTFEREFATASNRNTVNLAGVTTGFQTDDRETAGLHALAGT